MFLGNVSWVISDFSPFTWLRCYQKVLGLIRVCLVESDLTVSGARSLVSTWTGTAVRTMETFTTCWSLNKHRDTSHTSISLSSHLVWTRGIVVELNLWHVKSLNLNQVDVLVYRDRGVAERRAAGGRDAQCRSAYGQSVNTSEDGATLINTEMDRQVSNHHMRVRHNLKSVVKCLTVKTPDEHWDSLTFEQLTHSPWNITKVIERLKN